MLVLQVPLGTMGDFDRLIEAAERLDALLKDLGRSPVNEAGSGEGNLFIRTDLRSSRCRRRCPASMNGFGTWPGRRIGQGRGETSRSCGRPV